MPGVVYTPDSGLNLAGVAFGHDWLATTERYAGTLEHLASWGIVAAAPDTETSIAPSVLNLAFDLGTALDIVAGVRLGPGKISVHPTKLGVVGHGFGGSAAVFAAAGMAAGPHGPAPRVPGRSGVPPLRCLVVHDGGQPGGRRGQEHVVTTATSLRAELDDLLAEGVIAARQREATTFEKPACTKPMPATTSASR